MDWSMQKTSWPRREAERESWKIVWQIVDKIINEKKIS